MKKNDYFCICVLTLLVMKHYLIIPILTGLLLGFAGCKKAPQNNDIITKKPVVKAQPSVLSLSKYSIPRKVNWLGTEYTVTVSRYPDATLPKTEDESGRKYYDNRINLKITRSDGTEFFNRTFTKADFSQFTDNAYGRKGALLGIVFDHASGNELCFGASVGSPDTMSDEYIPLILTVSNVGAVSIKADTQLDTGSDEDSEEADD